MQTASKPSGSQTAVPGFAGPTSALAADQRIAALDFIRGVAILGMVFANITAFAHPFAAYSWPGALPGGGNAADGWVWLFQFVFVDHKFRGLFTLLFGAGLALLAERGAAAGRQARRLGWLLVFGLIHFALLFSGDILVTYALAGFVGLLFVHNTPRWQIAVGAAWYVSAALLLLGTSADAALLETFAAMREQSGQDWAAYARGWQAYLADMEVEHAVYSTGTYGQVIAYRLTEEPDPFSLAATLALTETVPVMLLGMGLYRAGLFTGDCDPVRMRRWGAAAVITGALVLTMLGALAMATDFPPYLTSFLFVTAAPLPSLVMMLGYAALLVFLAALLEQTAIGRWMAAAGRMAFTNYIATSLMLMLIFQGWAGGLYGQLDRLMLLPIVLLVWIAILGWSAPLLARFGRGPLETVWRRLVEL